jgi:ribokinase
MPVAACVGYDAHVTSQHAKPIVVIGSINMDLVIRVPHMPRPGQTLLGEDLLTVPGGKGANQAVAAAKLGGDVHMVGRVGDDSFGDTLLAGLKTHGVDTTHVTVTEGVTCGTATILVDGSGENAIVVSPAANARVSPADVDAAEDLIKSAACVMLQLEIPLATVAHAVSVARRHGVPVILDPAPAPTAPLPAELWGVDVLTPNETESEALLRVRHDENVGEKMRDAAQIAVDLLHRGPRTVLLKLGARGALAATREGQLEQVGSHAVKVVDTTAAGDAFTAGYAVGLAEGLPLLDRIKLATAAGALACTKFGAQPAMPSRAEVDRLRA